MKKTALAVLIFGALNFFVPGTFDPYVSPKLLFVALAALPLLLTREEKGSSLEPLALAFFFVVCVSALFAVDPSQALIGSRLFYFDSVIGYAAYVAVLAAAARSNVELEEVVELIVLCSVPMVAYAIVQRFVLNADPLLPAMLPGTRVVATQGSPVFLGPTLAVVLLSSLWLSFKRLDVRYAAYAAVVFVALLFTQTRGALLGVVAGLVFLVPARFAAVVLGVGLLSIGRVVSIGSDAGRLELYHIGWRVFMENKMLGVGPGNFYLAFREHATMDFVRTMGNSIIAQDHAHSDIGHVLATLGIGGFVLYVALLASVVFIIVGRDKEERPLLFALFCAFFVMSKLNPMPFALIAMLAVVLGSITRVHDAHKLRYAPIFLAAACAFVSFRVSRGELFHARAIRAAARGDVEAKLQALDAAVNANPWDVQIASRLTDTVLSLREFSAPGHEHEPVKVALELAREQVRKHPRDSFAHELYGKCIVISAHFGYGGNLNDALREFTRAQELAPTFKPVLVRRRAVAQALGEWDQFIEADSAIRALDGAWRKS